jgi:hypothetical protein
LARGWGLGARDWVLSGKREKKFKIQMANGKLQMENHLKFAICRLPFDLLVCLWEWG